jgi:hypothetical protein
LLAVQRDVAFKLVQVPERRENLISLNQNDILTDLTSHFQLVQEESYVELITLTKYWIIAIRKVNVARSWIRHARSTFFFKS